MTLRRERRQSVSVVIFENDASRRFRLKFLAPRGQIAESSRSRRQPEVIRQPSAGAYLVFQDRPEDPFILLRDGAIFGTEDYPEQKISSG
jgi:hypothetical protein